MDPALRGYGLGRQVMEEAESSARGIGIQNIHLSTHDKQQFYAHLGYCRGPVVSPQRMCMASLKGHHVSHFYCCLYGNASSGGPYEYQCGHSEKCPYKQVSMFSCIFRLV